MKATDAGQVRQRPEVLRSDAEPPEYDSPYIVGESAINPVDSTTSVDLPPSYHSTHRRLKGRHIQLIGMGGAIGTVLFVQLGVALTHGGPGSLFISFAIWCIPILAITNCAAEYVTYLPISSPFIRMAGRTLDSAAECMAGWNFFILQATLVPFEITAVNIIINFWTSDYSPAITLSVQVCFFFSSHFPVGY
jgi:amino acid transporter